MERLTKAQQGIVKLIESKQTELGKELYFRCFQNCGNLGMCIIKLIENNTKCEIVEKKINTRVVYSLLDKGVLQEKKINENLTLVTLTSN